MNNPLGCIFPEHINSQLPSEGGVAALHSSPVAAVPRRQPGAAARAALPMDAPSHRAPCPIRAGGAEAKCGSPGNGSVCEREISWKTCSSHGFPSFA